MRLSVASLRRVVKRDLPIEFVPQQLTSHGGLELLRRYLQRVDLAGRLRRALGTLGGDYGSARLSLLVLALLYVGGRRLEHLQYLARDPLVQRFCGLGRVPTARTVGNWLRTFTRTTLTALSRLNHELVTDAVAQLDLPRLTIDVDGTVVTTVRAIPALPARRSRGWAIVPSSVAAMSRAACGRARRRAHARITAKRVGSSRSRSIFHASAGRFLQRIAAPASRRWSAFPLLLVGDRVDDQKREAPRPQIQTSGRPEPQSRHSSSGHSSSGLKLDPSNVWTNVAPLWNWKTSANQCPASHQKAITTRDPRSRPGGHTSVATPPRWMSTRSPSWSTLRPPTWTLSRGVSHVGQLRAMPMPAALSGRNARVRTASMPPSLRVEKRARGRSAGRTRPEPE
jgi:hypothetical protein